MDHASWIPRATFFEIAVYLKTCWHNDIIAYVGNVNIDLNIQAKDQFFPYVVMLMPLCYYHVRMFTNEAWRHNLLCNILFTDGPITGELISRMTYISGIYFAHLFCVPKFLNDRWEQCVLLVVPLWVNRAELLWSTAKFLSFDFWTSYENDNLNYS